MKVFEEDYQEGMKIADAIPMGLKALHAATEGKFDVNNVEIGVIGTEDGGFRRMSREEVDKYVENFNFDAPEEKQEEE